MVLPSAKLTAAGGPLLPLPSMRIQTKWWDQSARKSVLPVMNLPEYACGDPLWPFYSGVIFRLILLPMLHSFWTHKKKVEQGETIQSLFGRLSEPWVAGVPPPVLKGHFTVPAVGLVLQEGCRPGWRFCAAVGVIISFIVVLVLGVS